MLVFYNQRPGFPLESAIQEACQRLSLRHDSVEKTPDHLNSAQCAVFHGAPAVPIAEGGTVAHSHSYLSQSSVSSADGLVVIWVSSAPLDRQPERVAFAAPSGRRGVRYLLSVRRTEQMGLAVPHGAPGFDHAVAKWEALLKAVLDRKQLDDWFDHPESRGSYPILDEAFRELVTLELLSALAILCQACLAANANFDSGTGNVGHEPLAAALSQMGWAELARGQPDVAARVQQCKELLRAADWWRRALDIGDRWADFTNTVAFEWGDNLPEAIGKLLASLERSESLDPKDVAEAYCQLAVKLGGQPCPAG